MEAILPVPAAPPAVAVAVPVQASTDDQAVALWLHGRPERTQRAYAREVRDFLATVSTPLRLVTLADVQRFLDQRQGSPATRARTIGVLKSLYTFLARLGYVGFNVAAPVKTPAVRRALAERILAEPAVHALLYEAKGWDARNYALLLLAYAGGLRVSELVGLRRRDLQARELGGQVTVFGKGGQTRAVVLPSAVWARLLALGAGGPDDPLFVSRAGGHLSVVQAWRIVRTAAKAAGLNQGVSPHWLRHAHASHALDRGAPISLVQATLGHASVATTGRYTHARPGESSGRFLGLGDV